MRPVEGTILTVVREAAEAVEALAGDSTLADVLERAYDAACEAVERTPQLLPALRDAGVVDAGGKGFTLLARRAAGGRLGPGDPRARGRDRARGGHRAPRGRRPLEPALRGDVPARRARRHDAERSARRGARSATRSSSSAATVSGTATSTRTTSAARSRPASTRAGRTGSGSPTSSSRSKRNAGSARPTCSPTSTSSPSRPVVDHRGRRGRCRARASGACSRASACNTSSPAASR